MTPYHAALSDFTYLQFGFVTSETSALSAVRFVDNVIPVSTFEIWSAGILLLEKLNYISVDMLDGSQA